MPLLCQVQAFRPSMIAIPSQRPHPFGSGVSFERVIGQSCLQFNSLAIEDDTTVTFVTILLLRGSLIMFILYGLRLKIRISTRSKSLDCQQIADTTDPPLASTRISLLVN